MTKTQGKMIKWTVLVGVFLILALSLLGCVPTVEANSEPLMSCVDLGRVNSPTGDATYISRCTMLDTGDICYVSTGIRKGGISCNFSGKIGE